MVQEPAAPKRARVRKHFSMKTQPHNSRRQCFLDIVLRWTPMKSLVEPQRNQTMQ